MLNIDLAAANVPYVVATIDGPRHADFHALRHSYLSALFAAGVAPKELRELARHGDLRLTLGVYTHSRTELLGAAVARLPLPGAEGENPLAALSRSELEAAADADRVWLHLGCTSGCTHDGDSGGLSKTDQDDERPADTGIANEQTPGLTGVWDLGRLLETDGDEYPRRDSNARPPV